MKQSYNSAQPFVTEFDLLWQSMYSTHIFRNCRCLYSEPYQTSKMELFANILSCKLFVLKASS